MQLSRASLFIAPLMILFLFAPTLTGSERLAFRDVSHFYTPLYDYVAARTADHWLPLWNPLDQTGIPLIGETTTAVLYPVRYLLFSLSLETETALAWYVVLHLILASVTARLAAYWAGVGPMASNIAGILYPLSGSLLFLYTNPPFLVGAAWLPLVLGVMLSRRQTDDRTRILIAAPAMAMMILGGDPQTALHAMMVIGLAYLIQRMFQAETELTPSSIACIPILAALLSAPQLMASIFWSYQSDRVSAANAMEWFKPPALGSQETGSFEYSLPPWHVLELATPNAFGSLFPTYDRVSQLITGDGRMWTPTIYMGMIVVVGIALCLGRRNRWKPDRWSVIALATLWLSMGHFGLVMLIQTSGVLSDVASAVGGPYWLLYQFMPGYDSFRYPAKWLPLFALAVSIATADLFDRYDWRRLHWRWFALSAASFALAFGIVTTLRLNVSSIAGNVNPLPADDFWGPMNINHGFSQIQWSLIHSATIALSILGLTLTSLPRQTKLFALLVIVAVDLSLADHRNIATVSIRHEQRLIEQSNSNEFVTGSRWMRTQAGDGWPEQWKQVGDQNRLLDVEASLRMCRFGRWHLSDRISMFNNMVSIQSKNMKELWDASKVATEGMDAEQRDEFWRSVREWLAIDGVIHTSTSSAKRPDGDRVATLIDYQRTWKPHQGSSLRLFPGATEQTVAQQNKQDFAVRLTALVASKSDQPANYASASEEDEQATYRGIELAEGGLLCRPIYQDGNWVAEYSQSGLDQWQTTKVYQVDRLTQGVILPEGRWDLRFQYKPRWLQATLAIAALAWIGLVVWSRT